MKTAKEVLYEKYDKINLDLFENQIQTIIEAMEFYASLKEDSKINKRRFLFQFFLWFRTNGELYVDKSIEDMIDIYLSELPSPPKTENK